MKRTAIVILAIAVFLSSMVFPTAVMAADEEYVDVAQGKAVGGSGVGGAWTGLAGGSSIVDGDDTTQGGFYANYGVKGYMYIDLGRAYKINRIEVLAYNSVSYDRASRFDIIAAKEVPDAEPFDENNDIGEIKVAYVDSDESATTPDVGYKTFYMPEGGEAYRYISFEKFIENYSGLLISEVKVFVNGEDLPKSVNVSEGKTVGGKGIGGAWTGLAGEASNLTDGSDSTETGFYANFGVSGYLYIDLGAEYKIDRIEILTYNSTYADRAGDFDLVVSNKLPDETPAADNPDKTLVTHVGVDGNATSAEVGFKSFSLPEDTAGNAYRYISLEKLQSNGYGLLVQEVKVFVLEEDLPLHLASPGIEYIDDKISITADLTNGGREEITFLLKSYDENGMVQGIGAAQTALSTFVAGEPFSMEIDVDKLTKEENYAVDLMAVDSLSEMNPVLYVENALSDDRSIFDFERSAEADFSFTAQQKGMNAEISGTVPGNVTFAALLYPDADLSSLTAEGINDDVAFFGYAEPLAESGEFTFEIVMPEKARSGEYTAVLGVLGNEYSVDERTAAFEFVSIVEEFDSVTAETFLDIAEKYSDSYSEIFALLEARAETIGNSFMLAKAVFERGKANEELTELNSALKIKEAMRGALLIDATINSEDFGEQIDEYKDTMPLIFGEEFDDAEEFVDFLNQVKRTTELNNDENIVKAYRKSVALAILSGGTRADVANVIENYGDAMDIDLEELKDAEVTVNEVAKKISVTDTAIEGYLKNGMGDAVSTAVDEVLEDKEDKKSSGGSSGGGGGGGGSSVMFPAPSVSKTPQTENTVSTGASENEEVGGLTSLYTDMKGYEWADAAVAALSQREILNGTGDGSFSPGQPMTREQAAKLIVLTFGLESTMKTNNFADCDIDLWYYPYVTAASANGVVKGTSRTTFGVGSYVTRQDMAVMLERALQLKGLVSGGNAPGFGDMDDVSDYAKDSVMSLAAMNIVNGTDNGLFCPLNSVTRAEAAVMLHRILELL